MTISRPADVEIQLQNTKEPVRHVGRVGPVSRRGKLHIRREVCYGRDEDHKATLCGQPWTSGFKPVVEAIKDQNEIDCRSCRGIAGLGPIKPRST